MALRTIKHGLFRYYNPEKQIINGEEKEVLVERMAFHNETVDVPRDADLERGAALGAFWTQEEARAHYDREGLPSPVFAGEQEAPAEEVEEDGEGSSDEVELTSLDDEALRDWLTGTGQFDGQSKPTASEVVAAGEEGGPQFATRLIEAERIASGDAPRKSVVEPLEKVAEGATA